MRAMRRKDEVILTFNFLEDSILRRALAEITELYQIKPDELDPKIADCWYSTRGCKSAKMSGQETQDWLANLHDYKSANLKHLVRWNEALSHRQSGQYELVLPLEEATCFVTVMNDHRLLLAARHDIGQKEMDVREMDEIVELKAAQQAALYSIHFFAGIIEELICLIDPDAGSWKESAIDML